MTCSWQCPKSGNQLSFTCSGFASQPPEFLKPPQVPLVKWKNRSIHPEYPSNPGRFGLEELFGHSYHCDARHGGCCCSGEVFPVISQIWGSFPGFALVLWECLSSRMGQGCGGYHTPCKSNLSLSPISNDFLLTPTFFSFLFLHASSIFLLPKMKTGAVNPILIPFAQPTPSTALVSLIAFPLLQWEQQPQEPFSPSKKMGKISIFFSPGILCIMAKHRIFKTFCFAGGSHQDNRNQGSHFSPSLHCHQEHHKSSPGTLTILIILFFIRS